MADSRSIYSSIESYSEVLNALKEYSAGLISDRDVLANAAACCDLAMGSDDISKTYIEALNIALKDLDVAIGLCDDLIPEIDDKLQELIEIYRILSKTGGAV